LEKALENQKKNLRLCVACRSKHPQGHLLRVSCHYQTGQLALGESQGRSAYLCKKESCLKQVLTTNKLKMALEGRRKKGVVSSRRIAWPLEVHIIEAITQECSNNGENMPKY
jgi:predicted RNA-binding protein YlxR (DUF448 family)